MHRTRLLALIISILLLTLTSLLLAADGTVITVWDGTQDAAKGWAAPTTARATTPNATTNATIAVADEHKDGQKSFELVGAGEGWIGAGWNWCGWWPIGGGTDISGCDRIRFNIKIAGDPTPDDFTMHLASSNKKSTPAVSMTKYMLDKDKNLGDGDWHQIVIPLKDIYQDKTDFDPRTAWEFDLGEWSADKKDFQAYVDNIQFLTPDAK